MIYEKLRIKDISRKLKNSEAIISAYIPENSEEININKKRKSRFFHKKLGQKNN